MSLRSDLRALLTKRSERRVVPLDLPGWPRMWLRSLTLGERTAVAVAAHRSDEHPDTERTFQARLCAASICDETGDTVVSWQEIVDLDAAVGQPLFAAVLDHVDGRTEDAQARLGEPASE